MSEAAKPGIKTSEFQASAFAAAIVGVLPVLFPKNFALTSDQQAQFIVAIVGIYTLGRSIVKAFGK